MEIRKFKKADTKAVVDIWNEVVKQGVAFPQKDLLDEKEGYTFFSSQSYTGVAVDDGQIVGMYILHPNNVGRCGHICNASYAVKTDQRGKHIGKQLVQDCMHQAKRLGFRILQFNAVVATNASALHLYQELGFVQLGTIPNGFALDDGTYEDIIVHYKTL